MFKGLIVGIILGALFFLAAIYLYFSTGQAPVATSSPEMPFERRMAKLALHAYLDRQPHPEAPVPADEKNLLAGAEIYQKNCAVCHGLPGADRTAIAAGMYPKPPALFKGVGVTDDECWETYWKVVNGIRMTGMPGFKGQLNDNQMWQVSVLLKSADKIPESVRKALVPPPPATPESPTPAANTAKNVSSAKK
jgi:thiosulfate dehydrogenase